MDDQIDAFTDIVVPYGAARDAVVECRLLRATVAELRERLGRDTGMVASTSELEADECEPRAAN